MNYALTNETLFSSSYIDAQGNFCCGEGSNDKMIRWVGCTPAIYKGSATVFSSTDIGLCRWFQVVTDYAYRTITLAPGQVVEAVLDAKFIMVKVAWPTKHDSGELVLESEKILELGINGQAGYVGMTIPFPIGVPDPPDYRHLVVKDLHISNAESPYIPTVKFNNISLMSATVGMLVAS